MPTDCSALSSWFETTSKEHFWIQWRFDVLRHLLDPHSIEGSSLEIGCGSGFFRQQLEAAYPVRIDGCDIDADLLKNAPKSRGQLFVHDFSDNPLPQTYKHTFLLDVLEHIKEPQPFLINIAETLEPNGLCLINVPAHPHLYSGYDTAIGHHKRYRSKELKQLITHAGLSVLTIQPWGMSLYALALLRKLIFITFRPKDPVYWGFREPKILKETLSLIRVVETRCFPRALFGASLMALAKKPPN